MPSEIGRAPGERVHPIPTIPAIEVHDSQDLLGIGAGSDILIADDDLGTLTAYEAALAPLGRNLVLVPSGVDALTRLAEQDFALLVLDVSMPGIDGLETAR
ncbi:MAG TPA: response regulator, partial [Kofleriaceae bacterium]|nr:response regulator [Kofleriaceae bacterium]